MTLADAATFNVTKSIVETTVRTLRSAGSEGYEIFVLWSGCLDGTVFEIRTAHVPPQKSYQLETGLLVRIEGGALHALNAWLFEHGEILGVQVHAHPTDAYHSETDDTYPVVTTVGALSVVAPNFASGGLLTDLTAAYRLTRAGWDELGPRDLERVMKVIP